MESEILAIEIGHFKSGVDIIAHAAKLKSYRELLKMCYVAEVVKGLTKLENLPQDEKEAIWAETKKECAGLSKRDAIDLAKVIYLISTKI